VIRKLIAVMLLSVPLWAHAEKAQEMDEYIEGVEYAAIVPPLSGAQEGKVKVVELFWYGCQHCFRFEPYINKWLKNKPEGVEFERIPAVFMKDGKPNPGWEIMARAYYTADVMGVLEKIHSPLFDALHVKKARLYSQEELRDFFAAHGVSGSDFDATFNSFAVNGLVANAISKTTQYGISGVPTLGVQGKYRVAAGAVSSFEDMLSVTNFLIAKESGGK